MLALFGLSYEQWYRILLSIGKNLFIAVFIFIVGIWLSGFVSKMVKKLLQKSKTDPGIISFTASFVKIAIKILVIITSLSQLGVQMTSFITLLGAAGLAIGMAFSGTLSNFAGGIMILVLKPFKVGDAIKAQNEQGTVTEIQIFNTYLKTVENKTIILPNGPLANGNIVNYTKQDNRRVDWSFHLKSGVSLEEIKPLIQAIVAQDKRILANQSVFIGIEEITENGPKIILQVWVKPKDIQPVFYAIQETIYEQFTKNNLLHSV
jgi:small conductance mechanosensitive channel